MRARRRSRPPSWPLRSAPVAPALRLRQVRGSARSASMAIRKVARLGHPVLRRIADPVSPEAIRAPEIQQLIDDMLETMAEYDGAGLAAPQVHVSRRIVIYGVEQNPRYPDAEAVPLTALVNPVVTPLTRDEEEDWEGCLSVPGLRGRVPRVTAVRVRALGRAGKPLDCTGQGIHAPCSPRAA